MNKWVKTILFIVIAAILTRWIPYSSFFRNVDTMIHEFGHAIMTLLVSGKVMYIHLFADHSGVTYSTVSAELWRSLLISLAGYTSSACFAAFMFSWYRRNRIQAGLITLALVAIINLIFFVRNEFGVFWCIGFVILTVIMIMVPWEWLRQAYYLLIAFILMVESVISALTLVIIAVQQPSQAGDAANLAAVTGIPAVIWALLFVVIAGVCARFSMGSFLGGGQRSYAGRRARTGSSRRY